MGNTKKIIWCFPKFKLNWTSRIFYLLYLVILDSAHITKLGHDKVGKEHLEFVLTLLIKYRCWARIHKGRHSRGTHLFPSIPTILCFTSPSLTFQKSPSLTFQKGNPWTVISVKDGSISVPGMDIWTAGRMLKKRKENPLSRFWISLYFAKGDFCYFRTDSFIHKCFWLPIVNWQSFVLSRLLPACFLRPFSCDIQGWNISHLFDKHLWIKPGFML